jgi:hypothetical protein
MSNQPTANMFHVSMYVGCILRSIPTPWLLDVYIDFKDVWQDFITHMLMTIVLINRRW